MIRTSLLLAFSVLLVCLPAAQSLACIMLIDPDPVIVDADGTATVVASIEWEHRKCVLEDDDVNFDGTNIEILKETGWVKKERGLFTNKITFKLTAEKGTVRIWRDCEKKGISEVVVKVKRG